MAINLLHSCTLLASLILCAGLFTRLFNERKRRNPNKLPLPPGPKGYPIIGNLLDMPSDKPWLVYDRWLKMYGDVVYFEVLGQGFLVLGSMDVISDLLEKRSSNYSDRMRLPMINELMGWDWNFGMQPYSAWWRRHRRLFHEYFHSKVVKNYEPTQTREARALLRRLLGAPDAFMQHIRQFFASTIMSIVYDIRVDDPHDPYVRRVETALEGLAVAGNTGTFLVDFIPALKYIPEWVPGVEFKRMAKRLREAMGTPVFSVASSMIERLPPKGDPRRAEEERIAKNVAGVAFAAGADTTISAVLSFFLAMAMHPKIQKKAQEEIDRVVGPQRLPEFGDKDSLPFVRAVVKEVIRWNMVAPAGMPHMATEEDEYRGWYIPRGTVVIGNGWSVLHDPNIFKDPLEFKPERFLKDGRLDVGGVDPESAAFGFGRRICPGRHLSDNSLYAIVSSVLAVFDINPPVDGSGKVVSLKGEMTGGLISYPVPFGARITPRSAALEMLVRDTSLEE